MRGGAYARKLDEIPTLRMREGHMQENYIKIPTKSCMPSVLKKRKSIYTPEETIWGIYKQDLQEYR